VLTLSLSLSPYTLAQALYCIYIASMFLYQEMSRRENRRRDRLAAEGVEEARPRPATKEDNTTDIDDLAFRYIL